MLSIITQFYYYCSWSDTINIMYKFQFFICSVITRFEYVVILQKIQKGVEI